MTSPQPTAGSAATARSSQFAKALPPAEPKRPVLKERKPLFLPNEATCGYAPAAYGTTG